MTKVRRDIVVEKTKHRRCASAIVWIAVSVLGGLVLVANPAAQVGAQDVVPPPPGLDVLTTDLLQIADEAAAVSALPATVQRAAAADPVLALRVVAAARARRAAMQSALEQGRVGDVLKVALPKTLRDSLPQEVQAYLEVEATVEGTLTVAYADYLDASGRRFDQRKSRYVYSLRTRSGEQLDLHFAQLAPEELNNDDLATGATIRLSGIQVGEALALVSGEENLQLLEVAPLVANTPIGAQNTAVILVRSSTVTSGVSAEEVRGQLFDGPDSVSNFFREASHGKTWLTGEVYGPYTPPACTGYYAQQFLKDEIGAAQFATYTRFVYVLGPGCDVPGGAGGAGTLGGNPSEAWSGPDTAIIAHEMGHNLGLRHSHSLICNQVSIAPSGCAKVEYGDTFDTMGDSQPYMHFNAVQKQILGWLTPVTLATVTPIP